MKVKITLMMLLGFALSACNSSTQKADEWYVFYQKNSGDPGICVEHKGKTIVGGSVKYEELGGPFATEAKAKEFSRKCKKCEDSVDQ